MKIIKIGGGEHIDAEAIIKDVSDLHEPVIIVYGANHVRDALARSMGKEKKVVTSLSGYSSVFSDEGAVDLIMMAYAGLKNKRIVEICQRHGINAVGLSGIDGQLIRSRRNAGIKVREGSKIKLLRDFSGKPQSINKNFLKLLLDNGFIPVISIPTLDENGYAINSENDDIVALIKKELQAETVIQLIEAPGLLLDKEDESSLIKEMRAEDLPIFEAKVEGRMKRKVLGLRRLFETGRCTVIICDGRVKNPVKKGLSGEGTTIR